MIREERNLSHSQNFLRSPEIVRSLLSQTDISSADLVVEIGAGTGIITRELAKNANKVIAIEYDKMLARKLEDRLVDVENVDLINTDFLKWNLPDETYKVFSNIPFDLTADIIRKLTQKDNHLQTAYLIMQDKALQRFAGMPFEHETQASLLLKPWFDVGLTSHIGRKAFQPVPNVNIVLAHVNIRKEPYIESKLWQEYRDFIVYGFNQWKPTISESFRKVFSSKQLAIIRKNAHIDLKPSNATINDWLAMFASYVKYVPDERKEMVRGSEKTLFKQQAALQKVHRTR